MITSTLIFTIAAAMPPLLVTIEGDARIETPEGAVIRISENSTFTVSGGFRLDPVLRELYLDNRGIFKDGFED